MFRQLCLTALFISSSAIAHPALDAIKAIDNDHLDKLPHRLVQVVTTDRKVTTEVALYNPAAAEGQRWTLESVNGVAPSGKEVAKFLKSRSGPKEPPLSAQIDPASLAPIDGAGQIRRWRFRFRRGLEIEGMALDGFSGQLGLNESGELASVDVQLDEPMRVKLIMKLNKMSNHVEYVKAPSGQIVQKAELTVLGISAAGLAINSVKQTRFELIRPGHGG